MKLAYDPDTHSLCIHLAERVAATSGEVRDGMVLDYGAAGALIGIDVQHASRNAGIMRLVVGNMPLTQIEAA